MHPFWRNLQSLFARPCNPLLTVSMLLALGWAVPCAAQIAATDANVQFQWARVLHKDVNDRGQADFCGLANDEADLRRLRRLYR